MFKKLPKKQKKSVLEIQNFLLSRLSQVEKIFSDFTAHDYGHALRTYDNLVTLVESANIVGSFKEEHCLVAILASLLHDIGMGPIDDEEIIKTIDEKGPQFTKPEKKLMRETHHMRYKDWILNPESKSEVKNVLGWVPEALLGPIAEVGCAHRVIPLEDASFQTSIKFPGDVRFLGALLRLADQMDLSPKRVEYMGINWEVVKRIKSESQRRAFIKSLADNEWFLVPDRKTMVLQSKKIELKKPVGLILEALYELEEEIQITIEETRDVPWKSKLPLPRTLKSGFIVESQASDNHRLDADFKQVWSYLYESMYNKDIWPNIAVREAISNSIDACNLIPSDDRDPSILIKYDGNTLTIQDNGPGMTLDIIENYLKVLGSSYYRSIRYDKKFTHREVKPSHIGTFGIGVFSYFLVSESFDILTKSLEDSTYRVHFFRKFGITIDSDTLSELQCGTRLEIPFDSIRTFFRDFESFKSHIYTLFPKPRIPLNLEYDSKKSGSKIITDRIEFVPRRNKLIQQKKNEIRIKIEDYVHNAQFRLGYHLLASFENLKEISDDEIIYVVKQYSHFLENLENYEYIFGFLIMYEGMRLNNEIYLQEMGPSTFALLQFRSFTLPVWLRSNFVIHGKSNYFDVWLDFNSGSITPDLTKMHIISETDKTVTNAATELDRMCYDVCKLIMSNEKVPRIVKEVLRYGILSWAGYSNDAPLYYLDDSWKDMLVYPMLWRIIKTDELISIKQIISEHNGNPVFLVEDKAFAQNLHDAFMNGSQINILRENFSKMESLGLLSKDALFIAPLAEWYSSEMLFEIFRSSGLKSYYKLRN